MRVLTTHPDLERGRRDRFLIIDEILREAKQGVSKTALMRKANLSYSQIMMYLQLLKHTRLVDVNNRSGNNIIKTTRKGYNFIERYEEIIRILNK